MYGGETGSLHPMMKAPLEALHTDLLELIRQENELGGGVVTIHPGRSLCQILPAALPKDAGSSVSPA